MLARDTRAQERLLESAPIFAALGDETRLRLLSRLSGRGPLSITALADGAAMTRQAITKHLRVMEGAGIVRSSREGRESLWQVEAKPLEEAKRNLDLVSRRWDEAIERLRRHVER